jgi:hypothetical protein
VTGEKPDSSPATLAWAVRLLYVEAAGMVVLSAYLVYLDLTARTESVSVAVALTVLSAIGAAFVWFVGRALGRRQSGARGPALVVQLMVIASGGFFLQTGTAWMGGLLLAFGALVGLLIVLPSSTRALGVD